MAVRLDIKHLQDLRNYKVSIEKAKNALSFKPRHDVESIVRNLIANMKKFRDLENSNYYNIQRFTALKFKKIA